VLHECTAAVSVLAFANVRNDLLAFANVEGDLFLATLHPGSNADVVKVSTGGVLPCFLRAHLYEQPSTMNGKQSLIK